MMCDSTAFSFNLLATFLIDFIGVEYDCACGDVIVVAFKTRLFKRMRDKWL